MIYDNIGTPNLTKLEQVREVGGAYRTFSPNLNPVENKSKQVSESYDMSFVAFANPAKVCLQGRLSQGQRCERSGRAGQEVAKVCPFRRVTESGAEFRTRCIAAPPTPVKERTKATPQETKPLQQRETKQPEQYRLYIYDDPFNKRERVVDVLLKTCAGLTFSKAYAAMQEAHETGRGLVLIIAQEIAEHYCACILSGTFFFFPFFVSRVAAVVIVAYSDLS